MHSRTNSCLSDKCSLDKFKMSDISNTISLLNITHRNSTNLVNSVKDIRVSYFSTPSSFYIQLKEEDEMYNLLEKNMQEFYNSATAPFYCEETNDSKFKVRKNDQDFPEKLKVCELKSKMSITVKFNNKWTRCITQENPCHCKIMDTGRPFQLLPLHEREGIYELEHRFLVLPPRAILCGLSGIIPVSVYGHRWSLRACEIFKRVANFQNVRGYFVDKGIIMNAYYVFLTGIAKDGSRVHLNSALCAFDTAIADTTGLHHPIWPSDSPC